MKKKNSFWQAGPAIVKDLLKSRWMLMLVITFALLPAFTAVRAVTAGQGSALLIGLAVTGLFAFAAVQLILLYRQADGKALRRLAVWCRVLGIVLWVLAGLLILLTVLGVIGIVVSGENTDRIRSMGLMGLGTGFIVFLAVHTGLIRKALLQAGGLLEGQKPERDAFRPAAVSAFILLLLSLAAFMAVGQYSALNLLILLTGILEHLSIGCLFREGSRRISSRMQKE